MAGTPATRAHRRRAGALIAYGLLVAVLGSSLLSRAVPAGDAWPMLGTRLTDLQATTAAVDRGAPPLVASTAEGGGACAGATPEDGTYCLVGQGDDQGLYVAAPLVTNLLGLSDPREGIKWLYIALFFVAFASYPLIFHRITGSVRAAAVAPLALLAGMLALNGLIIDDFSDVPGDMYWVLAWTGVALLPPLLLLARERSWGRWGFALLFAVALVAAAASLIRINAGLPIVIAGLCVLLFSRPWSWPRRLALALALLAAYAVIVPAGMSAIRSHAEAWAGDRGGLARTISTQHPFWHSVFIGSGYLPNPDNVIYRDEVGFMRAQDRDPGVQFATPHYEDLARSLFFDEVRDRPFAIAWQEVRKATVIIRSSAWAIFGVTILFVAGYFLLVDRRLLRWALVLALPGLALGTATGLLVIPDAQYVLAWTGALLFLLVSGTCALTAWIGEGAPLERGARAIRGLQPSLRRGDRSLSARGWVALAGVASVVFTLVGSAGGMLVYHSFQVWWIDSSGTADIAARTAFARTDDDAGGQDALQQGVGGPRPALRSAVGLDGLSGHVLSDYDPFGSELDLTVEGWAKRRTDDTDDTLFGSTGSPQAAILRVIAATGDVQLFPVNGLVVSWPAAWPTGGDWVHWALVVDQGGQSGDSDGAPTAELFIDGSSAGVMEMPEPFGDGYGKFEVGGWSWNFRDPFDGAFAGVAVYPRALAAEEVASHATAGADYPSEVSASDPQLLWRLDERRGIEARDSSASGHDGVYAWDPAATTGGGGG